MKNTHTQPPARLIYLRALNAKMEAAAEARRAAYEIEQSAREAKIQAALAEYNEILGKLELLTK